MFVTGIWFLWIAMDSAEANILYLESPIGVGFSYAANSSSYEGVSDKITGMFFTFFYSQIFMFLVFAHYIHHACHYSREREREREDCISI